MDEPSKHSSNANGQWPAGRHGLWRRPCGLREVLLLALPMVVSTASWTVIHFIDRMFLTWYSADAMAAALPAGMLHFTLMSFPLGLAMYANTFVAQYHGARRPERIGPSVGQAVIVGLLTVPLLLASGALAPWMFSLTGHTPRVTELEVTYFQILTCGGGGAIIAHALATFFTGRGAMRVVMLVEMSAAGVNIVLDWMWIFGNLGFPEGGIAGAGWATVTALWFKVAAFLWVMFGLKECRPEYNFKSALRLDPQLFWRLIRFGAPSGLQMAAEVGSFALFLLILGQLGPTAMVATNLAFSVHSIVFVPMIGVAIATSTLVGQQLGAEKPDLAAQATWSSLILAMLYTGGFAIFLVFTPELFVAAHGAGADVTKWEEIKGPTLVLIRFVAVFCLFDALNLIFSGALKGAGDTKFLLLVTLVMAPVPVGLAWLGIHWLQFGLYFCWTIITGWIVLLGTIFGLRFLYGPWRRMRVIETPPADPVVEIPVEPPQPIPVTAGAEQLAPPQRSHVSAEQAAGNSPSRSRDAPAPSTTTVVGPRAGKYNN